MEALGRRGVKLLLIHDLGTRWVRVVSVTLPDDGGTTYL
jgi:hypothetical protein